MENISNHKNFLKSPDDYKKAQSYWKSTLEKVLKSDIQPWISNQYFDGREIIDGNPIYSVRFRSDKAIRIIQLKRNAWEPLFNSWFSDVELPKGRVQELVICLQPYQIPFNESIKLIETFIEGKPIEKKLQRIVHVYEKEWYLRRIKKLRNSISQDVFEKKYLSITENELVNQSSLLRNFKRINEISIDIEEPVPYLASGELKTTYNQFIRNYYDLNNVISIKNNIDFLKPVKRKYYLKTIFKTYHNNHNFIVSLTAKTKRFEDVLKKLNEIMVETEEVLK